MEIPGSVVSISDGAFAGCRALESIKIPNSVTGWGLRVWIRVEGLGFGA